MATFINKLRGKKVVIVGGTSGVGLTVAQAILEFGGEVHVASSRKATVDAALALLGKSYAPEKSHGQVLDLREGSLNEMEARVSSFLTQIGKVDHYIHCAGETPHLAPIASMDLNAAEKLMQVRLFAAMAAAKTLKKYDLLNPGGSIVLMSGSPYLKPYADWTAQASVIGAIVSLGKALAVDLAPIRCNVVASGPVDTPFWLGFAADPKPILQHFGSKCLLGKVAQPEDTAEAFLYCLRDGSLTGSVIVTDGGTLLM